ncbi:MAG: hypothetical protein KIS79_14955 [Burkholderiales bacterium]|nr:hypothetical protein [Burkholderiales bacterium]MCW5622405.1 hypothetical protein [Burkholderiales bacterium]
MGSRHFRSTKARPILNERDYRAAKSIVERELKQEHSDAAWARLEALMREIAAYEARFLQGKERDGAGWIEYAYRSSLDEHGRSRRRWSDKEDDFED